MNIFEKLAKIDTFIFDIDGVMTDGSVFVNDAGEALRVFNIKDGFALQLAIKKGYRVAIISGGKGQHLIHRLSALGIKDIFLGADNKVVFFDKYIQEHQLDTDRILYMGDDIPDLTVLPKVGLATCPADAAEELFAICNYISPKNGGKGCVRDVIEKVMKVQNKWLDETSVQW